MKIAIFIIAIMLGVCRPGIAWETETSWYTDNGKKCADGKWYDLSSRYIAASWDYPFGTRLRVSLLDRPDVFVIVTVRDRGPAKRLYRQGRRLDLSKAAFAKLAPLAVGVIDVDVDRCEGAD